jgi:hypothetical protein
MQEISIFSVRPYNRETKNAQGITTVKPMFAFNVTGPGEGFHLSFAQLDAAGVLDPMLLQGTTMLVEFFSEGETLNDGVTVVRDNGVIVKNFVPQVDREIRVQAAIKTVQDQYSNWRAAALAAKSKAPRQGGINAQPANGATSNTANGGAGNTATGNAPEAQFSDEDLAAMAQNQGNFDATAPAKVETPANATT